MQLIASSPEQQDALCLFGNIFSERCLHLNSQAALGIEKAWFFILKAETMVGVVLVQQQEAGGGSAADNSSLL